MQTPDLVMPTHPYTGQTAVYVSPRTGRAYWPIKGGSGEGDAGTGDDAGTDNDADNDAEDAADAGETEAKAKPTPKDVAKPAAKTEDEAPAEGDVASLPAWARKALKDANAQAAKERVTAKESAATEARDALAQKLMEVLDPKRAASKEAPPDPAALMAKIEQGQIAHRETSIELAVYKGAAAHGADPDALTDSRAFLNTLAKLDPASDGFSKAVGKAIEQAVKDNPKLSTTGQAPARASGEFSGGTGEAPASGTRSIDDIRAERRKRRAG